MEPLFARIVCRLIGDESDFVIVRCPFTCGDEDVISYSQYSESLSAPGSYGGIRLAQLELG